MARETLESLKSDLAMVRAENYVLHEKVQTYLNAGVGLNQQLTELNRQLSEYHELYALLKKALNQAYTDIEALKRVNGTAQAQQGWRG